MRFSQGFGLQEGWRQLVQQPVRRLIGGTVRRRSRASDMLPGSPGTGSLHMTATTVLTASAPASAVITTDTVPNTAPNTVRVLDERTAPEKLQDISTLILDCDGVLWRGSDIIHNAPEALSVFRRQGKRLLFVTNNSSKSREEYAQKFRSLGLEVAAEEIVSSSYCAAAYLTSKGFGPAGSSSCSNSGNHGQEAGSADGASAGLGASLPGRKVLLLGWSGVEQELEAAGIPYIGGRNFPLPPMDSVNAMKELQVDHDVGAVVVGWDPNFSYSKIVYASICLRELPGCRLLVATNTDCADHIGGGRMMPGTGGLVRAIEVASGVQAVNVAKGGEWILPHLCHTYGLDPARTAIIGDRLDTDIHLGRQGGLFTCLPLTGVTTLERLAALPCDEVPDVVVDSIAQLAGLAA